MSREEYSAAISKAFSDNCYAKHNPCTMVYRLVKQLEGKDSALNDYVTKKVEGVLL